MKNGVLNLIITGIPSIHPWLSKAASWFIVLNLIITGIPSIRVNVSFDNPGDLAF